MDPISEIIVSAVDKVKNAVVKIDNYAISDRQRISGSGSGFVFSSDGLILTNAHVVSNSEKLKVTLLDGKEYTDIRH
jgi:S1-C subfamily serine protease